jgi:SsrA-binding protein
MKNLFIKNKKSYFNYDIIETICAGLVLLGNEVKSIKNGNVSFNDSYCYFIDNELWLKNFYIADYENSSTFDVENNRRDRKLLLTKQQLKKFHKKFDEKGLTIIPLNIFLNDRGLIKMDIALSRGKKTFDKKMTIKERDIDRDTKSSL